MVVLAGQILELQMTAGSGANLDGAKMRPVRQVFQRIAVIESLNGAVALGQDLVPEVHPIVGNGALVLASGGDIFGQT